MFEYFFFSLFFYYILKGKGKVSDKKGRKGMGEERKSEGRWRDMID